MTLRGSDADTTRPGAAARWTIIVALLSGMTPPAGAAFVNVTPAPLLTGNASTALWLDYDGDGDPDLFLTSTTTNRLFRNDGGAGFTETTPLAWVATPNGAGVTCADYDNDGDIDLFAASNTVSNRLYRNDAGTLVDVAVPPISGVIAVFGASWLDYDRDGEVDLLLSNHNGPNSLYRNNAGVFASVSLPPTGTFTESFACGDYDGDGDTDVFVCCPNGPVGYLLRNHLGVFADVATAPLTTTLVKSGTWGDFDNDGDPDLFGVGGNRMYFMRNDGGGAFVDISAPPFPFVGGVAGTLVDYDNDGDLDASAAQFTRLLLIRNNGTGFSADTVLGTSGYDMSWADYDGDGDLDVFATGPGQLFRNELPPGRHWLHLDLVGTVSNRSAIGARVELWAGGVRRSREVAGITSFGSQNSLTVAFGLGATASIDSVIVRWPSGTVQRVSGLGVDARHTIFESAAVSVEEPAGAVPAPRLGPARPNPAPGSVGFELVTPTGGLAELAILDLQGRTVTTLPSRRFGIGRHAMVWDPRGVSSAPAPAGVYFARLRLKDDRGRTTEHLRRFVLIR